MQNLTSNLVNKVNLVHYDQTHFRLLLILRFLLQFDCMSFMLDSNFYCDAWLVGIDVLCLSQSCCPSYTPYCINSNFVFPLITYYQDKSFTFITKTPPAAVLLKRAANLAKGSGEPNRNKVGKVTSPIQVRVRVLGFAQSSVPRGAAVARTKKQQTTRQ